MKLTTIMDNRASGQKALIAEHGLSFLVELEEENVKILFDFGAGAHTWENAQKLNVKPGEIDCAVGSHGHYDHAGGYPVFVANGLKCPLYTGGGYFREKYAFDGVKGTYLGNGFDMAWMREQGLEHRVCRETLKLAPGCYLVGDIERSYEFEKIPGRFVLREENGWIPDDFRDEICLVLDQPDGQIVILGCSHPGILNMLTTVQRRFGKPIKAVFGGTHLVEADRKRIEKTIEIMKTMGIGLIGFNHCSGDLMQEMMAEEKELRTCYLGAGDCICL